MKKKGGRHANTGKGEESQLFPPVPSPSGKRQRKTHNTQKRAMAQPAVSRVGPRVARSCVCVTVPSKVIVPLNLI